MSGSPAAELVNNLKRYWLYLPVGTFEGEYKLEIVRVCRLYPVLAASFIFSTRFEIKEQAVSLFVPSALSASSLQLARVRV